MSAQAFTLPIAAGTNMDQWRTKINDAVTTLLETNKGSTDPATTGDAYAVNGSFWFKDSTSELFIRDAGVWVKIADTDLDQGGALAAAAAVATGNMDLDGYDLIIDTDGDTRIVNDRDAGFSDDEFGIKLGGVTVLQVGKVQDTQQLFDMMGILRLAQPQGIVATTPTSSYGNFIVDIDGAGTKKYVQLFNNPS
jgi:hypothetical protein